MSDVVKRITDLSPEKLELLLRRTRQKSEERAPTIPPQKRDSRFFPLSFAQQRLWFLDQWEPNSPLYNISFAVQLTGKLQVETLEQAIHALARRHELYDVVVFTNALNIALELESAIPRFTVVVTGGTLRPMQHSLVDPLGGLMLERINARTVFLGCNGIDPIGGITNINLPEAEIKRRMLQAARQRIIVADGSKVGRIELAYLCGVDEIDLLITDSSADPSILNTLREKELQVMLAK